MAAVALALGLGACSGSHSRRADQATTTSLPPGTITADVWNPPQLSGPPSQGNFCAALTAIYRHMAELPHVLSVPLTKQFLGDYVSYQPTLVAEAPAAIRPSAQAYTSAVARYLQKLSGADLELGKLPPGALTELASKPVNDAYTALSGYSQNICHYTIGGQTVG
jgi:hypothetical protein